MLFMDLEASTTNRIWSYVREEPSNKLARLGDTLVRNYDGLTQNWLVCLLSIFHLLWGAGGSNSMIRLIKI